MTLGGVSQGVDGGEQAQVDGTQKTTHAAADSPPSLQDLPNTRTFLQTSPAVTDHCAIAPLSSVRTLNNPTSPEGQRTSLCPKQLGQP